MRSPEDQGTCPRGDSVGRLAAFAAFIACVVSALPPVPARAARVSQEQVIEALFDEAARTEEADANHDGVWTAADVIAATPGVLFAGVVANLVPHAVGDTLVYRVTDAEGKITIETAQTVSSEPGGAFVVEDVVRDGERIVRRELQRYLDTGLELFYTGNTDFITGIGVECTPGLLRLSLPVIAGQMFATLSRCRGVAGPQIGLSYDRTDTFMPVDVLDRHTVEAGTFAPVIRLRGSIAFLRFAEEDEVYMAPGVGAIFQRAQDPRGKLLFTRELISATIGGRPIGQ